MRSTPGNGGRFYNNMASCVGAGLDPPEQEAPHLASPQEKIFGRGAFLARL